MPTKRLSLSLPLSALLLPLFSLGYLSHSPATSVLFFAGPAAGCCCFSGRQHTHHPDGLTVSVSSRLSRSVGHCVSYCVIFTEKRGPPHCLSFWVD